MKVRSQTHLNSLLIASTLGFTSQAALAVTAMIPTADFAGLNGLTSGVITVAGLTDNGVVVDLDFTFSTSIGTLAESGRLGITSTSDIGSAGTTAVNSGEILSISVTPTIVSVPTGQSVLGIDFGIIEADMVRSNPDNGDASYLWSSSAASFNSPVSTTTGAQPVEELDGTSLFDIFSTAYNATFTTTETTATASGFRFVSDADNFDFDLQVRTEDTMGPVDPAIPEPSRAVLLGLGALAMFARRRR